MRDRKSKRQVKNDRAQIHEFPDQMSMAWGHMLGTKFRFAMQVVRNNLNQNYLLQVSTLAGIWSQMPNIKSRYCDPSHLNHWDREIRKLPKGKCHLSDIRQASCKIQDIGKHVYTYILIDELIMGTSML